MIRVKLIDVISGYSEKKEFANEEALQNYLNRNPFIIAKNKECVQWMLKS